MQKISLGCFKPHRHLLQILLISVMVVLCSCDTGSTNSQGKPSSLDGEGCNKIAILLPDSAYSARWDSKDRPYLINDIRKHLPNASIDYFNAQGDYALQQKQAERALQNGDCILVLTVVDNTHAKAIIESARSSRATVIAYDRFIDDAFIKGYISFDNFKVGVLQGQYIAMHHNKGDRVILIYGSQLDSNVAAFSQGALSVLQPLFKSGELVEVYSTYTPDWSDNQAHQEMHAALIKFGKNVQIVYAANDGLANGIIAELKTYHLNGKVLVTGQDATVVGLQNILLGDQAMTVYKNVALEADAAAQIVAAISKGTDIQTLTKGLTISTKDGKKTPSIIETPVSVDKTNIKTTVLADGYATKNDICQNIPVSLETNGICS